MLGFLLEASFIGINTSYRVSLVEVPRFPLSQQFGAKYGASLGCESQERDGYNYESRKEKMIDHPGQRFFKLRKKCAPRLLYDETHAGLAHATRTK